MHDGVGSLSPAAPMAPAWALQMWQGPTASYGLSRIWGAARDAVVRWLRPAVERLGVVEVVRVLEANDAFEHALMPFARSTYDRADLDAMVGDAAVHEHHARLNRAAVELTRSHPHLFGRPRARSLFPHRVLWDEAVRTRAIHGVMHLVDLAAATHALRSSDTTLLLDELDRGLETPAAERATIPCWWAYDPGMPSEIARRMLAGQRAVFLVALVRISRRNWPDESLRRAVLDWADDIADYCGLIAGITGVSMPSVPADRRMNLAEVLEHHRELRGHRQTHLEAGLAALRSN